MALYGAGLLGASVFKTKRQKANAQEITTERIQLVRASEWLETNVPPAAEIFMKFNCEGAECDILDELLSAGLAARLTSIYVDFDIRKVEGQGHRQAELERRLRDHQVRYVTPQSMGGSANPAVARWLAMDCPCEQPNWSAALRHRLSIHTPAYIRLTQVAKLLVPARAYSWLGHRFGRVARAASRRATRHS